MTKPKRRGRSATPKPPLELTAREIEERLGALKDILSRRAVQIPAMASYLAKIGDPKVGVPSGDSSLASNFKRGIPGFRNRIWKVAKELEKSASMLTWDLAVDEDPRVLPLRDVIGKPRNLVPPLLALHDYLAIAEKRPLRRRVKVAERTPARWRYIIASMLKWLKAHGVRRPIPLLVEVLYCVHGADFASSIYKMLGRAKAVHALPEGQRGPDLTWQIFPVVE